MAKDSPLYRPDIDGLRAIAVLGVVAYHAFPNAISGGFVGVDAFFVVSGYLISRIILRALKDGSFTFASFYARRARRILPALAIVLAACFAAGWLVLMPAEFSQLCRHIIAAVSFLSNVALWGEASYFDAAAESKPLLHLWSLGIEEQFYLVWPLMLVVAARFRRVLLVTSLLAVCSFGWSALEITSDHSVAAFYSPASRFWELLAGALLAEVGLQDLGTQDPGAIVGRALALPSVRHLASMAGAVLLIVPMVFFTRQTPFPGPWALAPVLGRALLIAAGPQALVNRAVLSRRALVGIGLISYPLYLWHWPLLSFAFVVGASDTEADLRLGLIAASVGLAALTYLFVERPIRRAGYGALKVTSLAAVMVAMVALSVGVTLAGGAASRFPEAIRALASYRYDYEQGAQWKQCWLAPAALDIYQLTRSACLPILGGGFLACARSNQFVLEQIRRSRPETVVLVGSWAAYGSAWQAGSAMADAFAHTLREIGAAGVRRIVVMGPSPRWNRPLPRLLVTDWIAHPDGAAPPAHMRFGLNSDTATIDGRVRAAAVSQGAS